MASEIKVDTIVNAGGDNDTGIDLATNDQILLKVANATKLTMNSTGQTTIVGEGGTTTTNLQQGLAKHWSNINQTGTAALSDSFNASSVTDNGTGDMNPQFTNNMNNAAYSVPLSCGDPGARYYGDLVSAASVQTSTYRTFWTNTSGSANDMDVSTSVVHGDLA